MGFRRITTSPDTGEPSSNATFNPTFNPLGFDLPIAGPNSGDEVIYGWNVIGVVNNVAYNTTPLDRALELNFTAGSEAGLYQDINGPHEFSDKVLTAGITAKILSGIANLKLKLEIVEDAKQTELLWEDTIQSIPNDWTEYLFKPIIPDLVNTEGYTDQSVLRISLLVTPTGDTTISLKNIYLSGSVRVLGDYGLMRWGGIWDGRTHPPNTMSLQDGYLGISLTTTDDPIAPVFINDEFPASELPGTPPSFTEFETTTSVLYAVQRYINPTLSYSVNAVGTYIPDDLIGFTCVIWLVNDPNGNPDYSIMVPEFTIAESQVEQWLIIRTGQTIVPVGTEFDLVAVFTPATGPITMTASWDYQRLNGNPGSGQAFHESGANQNILRFHQVDFLGTNRDTDLANVMSGSTIDMIDSGFRWDVLSASKITADVYEFIVEPAARANAAVSDFTFTWFAALPMKYVLDVDHFLSFTSITGGIFTSYDPGSLTLGPDAVGVDMLVQEISISPDWQIVAAISGSSGGTGGEFMPIHAEIMTRTAAFTVNIDMKSAIIECDGTFTVTLPDGLPHGFQILIMNVGTGTITLTANQLNSDGDKLETQFTGASCYYSSQTDAWIATGKLT